MAVSFKRPRPRKRSLGATLARATGMPTLDAADDFLRARRSALVWRVLRPGARHGAAVAPAGTWSRGPGRSALIELTDIVGTVEPGPLFDARLRPASERLRHRWERVALAHRRGLALPPIRVVATPDGYYVVDGRHRVSVARALGHREIDARID